MAKLPLQAIPPDKRAPEPPPPFEDMLPSGIIVQWRMPDPWKVITFDGVVPDPITAATIVLLREERSYTPESDPRKLRYDAQGLVGMYKIAGAMLIAPKLDPDVEYGSGDTLGRCEIGGDDVKHLYAMFRFFSAGRIKHTPDPIGPIGVADAASDSEGVRADAGAASGSE